MVWNVLNAKERTILPHQKFVRVNARNKILMNGRETIQKVHANLRLNAKPIKIMLDSEATVYFLQHSLKATKWSTY